MKTNTDTKRIVVTRGAGHIVLAIILGLLWLSVSATPVFAAEIIVDTAGADTSSCGTVGAPCRTIAYAVSSRAASGDTVFVNPGTYTETITMRPGVIISGTGAAVTFIDGEGLRGPMVTAGTGVTASAVLKGFTIRGGVATTGAGINVSGTASPELRDLAVISNTATSGGGLYVAATASPRIEGLEFRHNHASGTGFGNGGGGLYVRGSLTLTDTQVISNTASAHGGGVYQYTGSGLLGWVGGRLERNVAGADGGTTSDGGGMYVMGDLILTGTLVLSNTATKWGGGIYVDHNVTMTDVLVLDNTAGQWGGGLYQNVLFYDHVYISGGRFENNRLTWSNSVGGALFSSSPLTMIGAEVINNYANEGGGVHGSSSMTLTAVHVLSNTAEARGAGLDQNWLGGDDLAFWVYATDTYFENNVALTSYGGAIRVAGNAALTRTQVISNSAAGLGGGMYVQYDVVLHDTQIVSNTASGGGGIYQNGAGRQVTVTGGRIAHNVARNGGGGGLLTHSTLTLSGTHVLTNTCSLWGGGIYLAGALANANWSEVNLIGNRAGENGGGLYIGDTSAQVNVIGGLWKGNVAEAPNTWQGGGGAYVNGSLFLTGTQVINNSALGTGRGGGGIDVNGGVLRAVNSLFVSNSISSGQGAAVRIRGTTSVGTLIHTTIASGTVGSRSAVYVESGTMEITNTVIASYTVGLRCDSGTVREDYNLYFGNGTAIQGTVQSGEHSLSGDPRFLDPLTGNYHIDGGSAALDAGSFAPGISVDLDGNPRPTNTAQPDAPDIGCYENRDTTVRRTISDTLTFGAVCARQVFTDSGSLSAVTTSVVYANPAGLSAATPLQRTYIITTEGAGPVSATLTLCYTDAELEAANVDENTLNLYRYDGANWQVYSSTVNAGANTVTAYGIDAFSPWALAGDPPTAVDLQSFGARVVPEGVVLEWETALELDNVGFNLYRSPAAAGPYTLINATLIPPQNPGTVIGAVYEWLDMDVQPDVTYYYKLEDIDVKGVSTFHGPVSTSLVTPAAIHLYSIEARSVYGVLALLIPGLALLRVLFGSLSAYACRRRS